MKSGFCYIISMFWAISRRSLPLAPSDSSLIRMMIFTDMQENIILDVTILDELRSIGHHND